MGKPKICKNCKHSMWDYCINTFKCTRKCSSVLNVVTGDYESRGYSISASMERTSENETSCGADAKFYESRYDIFSISFWYPSNLMDIVVNLYDKI